MINLEIIRNGPHQLFVSHPVRKATLAVDREAAIPLLAGCVLPSPAVVGQVWPGGRGERNLGAHVSGQAGDVVAAEKGLQVLVKERDPRAQFLLGLYIYGNAESKLFDLNKAAPLLLDASERGYLPAMIPLAGAYAEGKGVPKSLIEAYKWCAIAEKWNVPNAQLALDQAARELKPDEVEKAKAAAAAFQFKTK